MKDFRAYLQSKNFTEQTVKGACRRVELFHKWLGKKLERAEKKDILDYIAYLREQKNLSSSTISIYLQVLNHYYNLLIDKGNIAINPTALIKIRGVNRKHLKKILTLEEIHEFIDLYYNMEVRDKPENQELYIVLTLAAYQAVNIMEWKALRASDIDLQQGVIHIPSRRRSNARTLNLQPSQIGVLYPFLQGKQADDYLIALPLSSSYFWAMDLRKLYPKFQDFKQLRASMITYWIQTEGLRKAQYKAGHRYVSSTEKFLANDLESLKEDINSFHPL